MAIASRFGFALEYVADIEAAKRFYVEVLGLQINREHPTFVQFKDPEGSYFAIAGDEPLGGGDERELYWLVDDADAAFADLSGKAEISLPLKLMPYGMVFGVKDPAGYDCFLVEFAQDRPSRRVS